MQTLLHRNYSNPNIVLAIAQVGLTWDEEALRGFCEKLRPEAEEKFSQVLVKQEQTFSFQFDSHGPRQTVAVPTFGGLETKVDDSGSVIAVEKGGYRVMLKSPPYPGRGRLLELSEWVRSRIEAQDLETECNRVSILYRSDIAPVAINDRCRIEDWIVPQFEFTPNTGLDVYGKFKHEVSVALAPLGHRPEVAHVAIFKEEGPGPISVVIDVIDSSVTDITEIPDRLLNVKDVESHIFESTITDNTRKLYGVV
jgi:uncharacterized protein (TIGR04255 family)